MASATELGQDGQARLILSLVGALECQDAFGGLIRKGVGIPQIRRSLSTLKVTFHAVHTLLFKS